MKEVYWEIKINKPGPRFQPELSLSGPAKVVYFDLPIYFLHAQVRNILNEIVHPKWRSDEKNASIYYDVALLIANEVNSKCITYLNNVTKLYF